MRQHTRSTFRFGPQILRRAIQVSVLVFVAYAAFGGIWRNYKVAHNSKRLVALMYGDTWGDMYGWNEELLSTMGDPYEASLGFLGMPWESTVFGIDAADPVIVAAHSVSTGSVSLELLADLLLPLLLVLLLGKVFCSHLCPMRLVFELGQMVRAGLVRLGIALPELRSTARFGGWVLIGGLLATMMASTAVWYFILPYLALSLSLFMYVATGAVTNLIVVALIWVVIDALLAPGFFCHNVCPTGFVLEQVGRLSLLKLRKRGDEPCPTGCHVCTQVCPYGLSPKERSHMPACDNCGKCATACPSSRLKRRFALPVVTALALLILVPATASAHHNKGLPHYGYFENYPQVPTEEYVAIDGKWEIGATIFNFQGMERRNSDTPNDIKIYTYIYDTDADFAYLGAATFEIRRNGKLVSRFDRERADEEAVYSTRETLPETGDYQLVAHLGDQEIKLDFYVDLGDDGINWLLVVGLALPVLLLFGLAIYGRGKKHRRPRRRKASSVAALALLLSLAVPAVAHAAFESPARTAERADESGDVRHDAEHADEGEVCPYCGMVDCTMEHVATGNGGSVMIMGGIPLWLFIAGIIAIILGSFVATEWLAPQVGKGFRLNLVKNRAVYKVVRSRWFQPVAQLSMMAVLVALIYIGLFGSQVANLTPVAVWTIWWGALIVAVLFFGAIWCFVCPWDGFANLFTRLGIKARVDTLTLGLHYPNWARNVYPAIILFAGLTWLELGYGVTSDARVTAYMGLIMVTMAVGMALLFDGKRFCAHACPVGRICGIYSTFSPVEIRGRKAKTCEKCRTEDCLHGNENGYPCPTGLSLKTITSSSMCTMCTECVKSCNKQNVVINLRPFGADLRSIPAPRLDEAWLALSLLALTLFHGFSMTPVWEDLRPGAHSILKWMALTFGTTKTVNFTIAMIAVCLIPIGLFLTSCAVGSRWAGIKTITSKRLFRSYAYSLLPIALFYHLAHNVMHLVMESGHVVPLLGDPMGAGANYLGLANVHLGHLISEISLWHLQVGLILTGHIFGIVVAHRSSRALFSGVTGSDASDKRAATRSLLPMLLLMIIISVVGLTLMHLDMNMRVGRM